MARCGGGNCGGRAEASAGGGPGLGGRLRAGAGRGGYGRWGCRGSAGPGCDLIRGGDAKGGKGESSRENAR